MIQKLPVSFVLTRYGRQLYLPTDCYVGKSLDTYAEFSPDEGALLHNLVQGKNVIEVGANQGALTLPLAVSAKRVFAYEPQTFLARIVSTLPIFNPKANVIVYNKAVGKEPGELFLPVFDYSVTNNYGGFGQEFWDSAPTDIEMVKTEVVTLDESMGATPIDFLKIDVEGMELDVLLGAKNLIANNQPVMYIENDRPPKAQALVSHLDSLGYTCYWHCPPLFNPNNFAGVKEDIFYGILSFNILCIPKGGAWFQVDPSALRCTPENPHLPNIGYPYPDGNREVKPVA